MNRKQRLVERGPFQALAGRVRSEPYRGTILMAVDSSEASRRSKSFNGRSEGDERPAASTAPASKTRARNKPRNAPNGGMALRGKENATEVLASPSRRRTKGSAQRLDVCAASTHESPTVVMDEDSNKIYPVGQFFGNLDVLPDYPERPHTTVTTSQRQNRRRHYYAKEDEDDETH
ncbi:UPF0688 protein C1orf174 homolog [Engraulis encrasicolus]|uniref:UPF0688 protein C1orf174 homolog n=1 Tax=Engraulis encrasicolus TaxID=184585 RepID=UPI002FCF815A